MAEVKVRVWIIIRVEGLFSLVRSMRGKRVGASEETCGCAGVRAGGVALCVEVPGWKRLGV